MSGEGLPDKIYAESQKMFEKFVYNHLCISMLFIIELTVDKRVI